MAKMNIVLPAMGEGVIEATINKWLVAEGTVVREDDPLVEVATDKVDSEVPSPADGTITSIKVAEGSVVKVGEVIAIIESSMMKKIRCLGHHPFTIGLVMVQMPSRHLRCSGMWHRTTGHLMRFFIDVIEIH